MSQLQPHPSPSPRAAPLSGIGRGRLVLGALVAAGGLLVALQWVGLPAAKVSLNQGGSRTDSVAAKLASPAARGASATAGRAASRAVPGRRLHGRTAARSKHRSRTILPRPGGKRTAPTDGTATPGRPPGNDAPGSVGGSSSSSSNQPPPPPPPPPPPTVVLPPPPAIPPVEVPQVPLPTVPQVPSVPTVTTPALPKLP
jgi:hypothetical protein